MAITRAKKTSPETPNTETPEVTAEQFIEGADASTVPPTEQSEALPVENNASKEEQAVAIVKQHLPWAAGAGILPIPGVDMAAIVGVQLRMLSKLSNVYEVPFKQQAAKSTIATLMAMVLQNSVAGGIASSLKFIPVVGTVAGIIALPGIATASTFAIGKVFITHFEAGGTFLDFDPKKVQKHFQAEFENAQKNTSATPEAEPAAI